MRLAPDGLNTAHRFVFGKRMEWRLRWSAPVGQPDEGGLYDRLAEEQVTLDARSRACGVNREPEGRVAVQAPVPRRALPKGLAGQ